MKAPKKALIIQLRRIGDVLMCTPAIRAFKKKYADCQLDFMTELPEVLNGNPYLDSIIGVDRSKQYDIFYQLNLIHKIRKSRYNIVIDFFANPRSAYYSFLSGAITRLSYGYGHRRWAYNLLLHKPTEPNYAAIDRLNLLDAINIPHDGPELEFYPSDQDRMEARDILAPIRGNRFITVSPVSRRAYRRWPIDRFAQVCKFLKNEYDFSLVILAGPGEEEYSNTLAAMLVSEKPLVPEINRLGLLGAVFENSALHIGNDNGPKHIAVACGTPTLAIFGADSHISWTFPDYSRHYFITPEDVNPGCQNENHKCGPDCINKIPADAVIGKIINLAASLPPTKQPFQLK